MKNCFYVKFYLFIFIFQVNIFADFNIKLEDITEYKINDNKVLYKISASQKRLNNLDGKRNILFFNKEKFVSENIFYLQGTLSKEGLSVNFEKAYFLEGKFIMLNVEGSYLDTKFISKKAIFDYENLQLKNSTITTKKIIQKKLDYNLELI